MSALDPSPDRPMAEAAGPLPSSLPSYTPRAAAGLLAGLASALIGGGWQVATRAATTTTQLSPSDLAILRYGIPGLVLLPLLWRTGLLPAGVPRRLVAGMVLGAGLPFGLLAMTGSAYAPGAHMGVVMAGAAPLFAAAFAWALWREYPDRWRLAGLAGMALGVGLLGSRSLDGLGGAVAGAVAGAWRGDLMFLLAAALWAGFTLSFRRTGLSAWQGAALVNAWSVLLLLPWLAARGQLPFGGTLAHDVLWQAAWQGLVAGLLGLWTFGAAIARLGATRAAAFGALVPPVSALGGWWWLGERLTLLDGLALACAVVGVMLASGAWPFRHRTA